MSDLNNEPSLASDVAAVREILSHAYPASALWTHPYPPSRHVYSKPDLLSLRHDRLFPLPASDPIRRSLPSSLPSLPDPSPSLVTARTADVLLSGPDAGLTFSDLALPDPILRALAARDLVYPSPVQLRALPVARLGADVIAQAKSGTGKTLVFGIVAAEAATAASPAQGPAALLLAPTRELATQTARVTASLCDQFSSSPRVALLIGGGPEREDEARLARLPPGVVVATPGRALALVERGSLRVDGLKVLVLDEADRLLDGSLGDAVPRICELLPMRKQTLAFSATYPRKLQRLLQTVMRNPTHIQIVAESSNVDGLDTGEVEGIGTQDLGDENRKAVLIGVRQRKTQVAEVSSREGDGLVAKTKALNGLLQQNPFSFCMVFTNNKQHGRSAATHLREQGFACEVIHANIRQSERSAVMNSVNQGKLQVLIATDLLARGVDIESCDLVVQMDIPVDAATYLHRVGRAGRFGKLALSVIMYSGGQEAADLHCLENALGFCMQKMHIPAAQGPTRKSVDLSATNTKPVEDGYNDGTLGHSVSGRDEGPRKNDLMKANMSDGTCRDGVENERSSAMTKRKMDSREDTQMENICYGNDEGEPNGDEKCENEDGSDMETVDIVEAQHGDGPERSLSGPVQKLVDPHLITVGNMSKEWDEYARRAYDEGYRDAYEAAYRMAKKLGQRLLARQG